MSDFTDLEYSVDRGEPFELYEFTRGVWNMYLTTRKTEFYVHDLQIYEPASITRGKIEHGEDPSRDQITITLPRNHDLVSEFINQPPETSTSVTVKKLHRGLVYADAVVIWKGRVVSCESKGEETVYECESVYAMMRRYGLRYRCELICQHPLYGVDCGANQPAVRFDDTISGVTNPTTLVMSATSSYADGWFSGGIIADLDDTRFITSHVGNTLTISRPLASLTAGTAVALYPGCDRTLATCVSKFGNVINALSFPWFPKNNPFTVSIK